MSIANIIKRCVFYQYNKEKEGFVLKKNDAPVYDVRTEAVSPKNEKIFWIIISVINCFITWI